MEKGEEKVRSPRSSPATLQHLAQLIAPSYNFSPHPGCGCQEQFSSAVNSGDQVTRNHASDLQLLLAPEVTSPARAVTLRRAPGWYIKGHWASLLTPLCFRARLHIWKKEAFSKGSNVIGAVLQRDREHPATSSSLSSSFHVKTI